MTSVDSLHLDERLIAAAKSSRVTTFESVLYLTGPTGALSSTDVQQLKDAVSRTTYTNQPVTALELLREKNDYDYRHLTTGCQVLDQALKGGILAQGITEVAGESASGKTQLGLQLSLTAQLPYDRGGLNAGTLYICTEDAFPSKRLYQMIQNFNKNHGNKLCKNGNLGDKIFIEHAPDFEGLMDCLQKKGHILLSSGAVRLIIIDSIAAHFRCDYDNSEMFKRAKHISSIGSLLYRYSHQYRVPVVCINQVTSSMSTQGRQLIPSLGLTWANQVSTRIMLARTNHTVTVQQGEEHGCLETVVREMEIIFAPHLPSITVPYIIDHEGMKGFKS